MAKPNQNDLQKKWEDRINDAVKDREEWSRQFFVDKSRDYFEGKQNPGMGSEWIVINKIYSHMQAQLPSLYSVDPYFYVKLKKSYKPDAQSVVAYEQKGKIRQAYLNYLKGELDLKVKARLAIQDAHFAYGVLKVHFSADDQENPDSGAIMTGEDGNPMIEDGEFLYEPDTIPINEKYNVSRVHPDDFIWGCESGTLEDKWDWVAEKIRLTKEEARADKRIMQSRLEGATREKSTKEGTTKKDYQTDEQKGDEDVYVLWEIYDLKKKQWLMIADGSGRPVMKPQSLPPGVEDHPYAVLRFTLRDKSPYPIPPISQGIQVQYEYNSARSKVMVHRKRFNRKYEVFEQGLADPDMEIQKLESGEDGTIIRKQVAQQIVFPISDAPLDPQSYQEIMALNNDMVEILGGSDNMRGIARADTATEASLIDKRLEVREGDRMSLVIDWIKTVAKKLDQLVQANITRDEAVRITGPEGEAWKLVRTDDYEAIEGEFEYSVNVGATMPRLPQVERSQWLAFLQVVGNFPQLLTSKNLVKKMAELHHLEDDAMVDELVSIGKQMVQAQQQQQAPAAGVPTNNPITAAIGSAMGSMGGNANGGGAQV